MAGTATLGKKYSWWWLGVWATSLLGACSSAESLVASTSAVGDEGGSAGTAGSGQEGGSEAGMSGGASGLGGTAGSAGMMQPHGYQLSMGSAYACLLLPSGAVRCWGDNSLGELGYGNKEHMGDNEQPYTAGNLKLGGITSRPGEDSMLGC
jgi:hypothetical protein